MDSSAQVKERCLHYETLDTGSLGKHILQSILQVRTKIKRRKCGSFFFFLSFFLFDTPVETLQGDFWQLKMTVPVRLGIVMNTVVDIIKLITCSVDLGLKRSFDSSGFSLTFLWSYFYTTQQIYCQPLYQPAHIEGITLEIMCHGSLYHFCRGQKTEALIFQYINYEEATGII